MKLQCAKNFNLNNYNSNLPNMSETIKSWFLQVTFVYVTRTVNEESADVIQEARQTINTLGVVRPPSEKELKLLPEGAWAWEWLQIHCLPDVVMDTNQYVIYNGIKYKVMSKKDYTKYGYVRYTLLEAYRAESEGL